MPATVTLLMPCRNAGPHLEPALRSLLAQTRQDFALVLVDDASTDGSPELARAVAGDRIRIERNAAPRGIPGNWNHALGLCDTGFAALVHQDDVYAPEWLAALLEALQRAPDAAFAHCRAGTLDGAGRPHRGAAERYKATFWRGLPAVDREVHFRRLVQGNFVVCPSVVLRLSAVRAVGGFRADLRFAADWELWLRLLLCSGPACAVDGEWVWYRRHEGAATAAAVADLSRYREELVVLEWARAEGIAAGWLSVGAPRGRALRNNLLVDALADLRAGDGAAADRKLAFLRDEAPFLWRDPAVRLFRLLRRCGVVGRMLLAGAQKVAVSSGAGRA